MWEQNTRFSRGFAKIIDRLEGTFLYFTFSLFQDSVRNGRCCRPCSHTPEFAHRWIRFIRMANNCSIKFEVLGKHQFFPIIWRNHRLSTNPDFWGMSATSKCVREVLTSKRLPSLLKSIKSPAFQPRSALSVPGPSQNVSFFLRRENHQTLPRGAPAMREKSKRCFF